jgi:hypothetical protein
VLELQGDPLNLVDRLTHGPGPGRRGWRGGGGTVLRFAMASAMSALRAGFVALGPAGGAGIRTAILVGIRAETFPPLRDRLLIDRRVVLFLAAHFLRGSLGLVALGLIGGGLGVTRRTGLARGRTWGTTTASSAASSAPAGRASLAWGATGFGGAGRGVGRTFGDHVLESRATGWPAQRGVGMMWFAGGSPQPRAASDREAVADGRCGGRVTS